MFSNKRILLTHIWLRGFSGAEINIFELASYFKKKGSSVEVFTFLCKSPMKEKFLKMEINVIEDFEHEFKIEDYDYIFVAQNIIPPAILKSFRTIHFKAPKFIFLHMAALPEHVLEQPYVLGLEERISSATLAISEEIIEKNLTRFFEKIPNLCLYPNPAPLEYSKRNHIFKSELQSVLVISNHPPKEILGIKEILEVKNIKVDYFGVWSDKYELVSPNLIANYDCVIGIGKNAQYCLVMGKPVYIYDHFKGPGFLTNENFSLASKNNFSGRGFEENQKSSEEIVFDLLEHYQSVQKFQKSRITEFRLNYTLDNILLNIYERIELNKAPCIQMDDKYIDYVISMMILLKNHVVRLENDNFNLWEAIHNFEDRESELLSICNTLKLELTQKNKELELLYSSKLIKVFRYIWDVKKRLLK